MYSDYKNIIELKREKFSVQIRDLDRRNKILESRQNFIWTQNYCQQLHFDQPENFATYFQLKQDLNRYQNLSNEEYLRITFLLDLDFGQNKKVALNTLFQIIVRRIFEDNFTESQILFLVLVTQKGFDLSNKYCKHLLRIPNFKLLIIEKARNQSQYLIILFNCIKSSQKLLMEYFRPSDFYSIIEIDLRSILLVTEFYLMILDLVKFESYKEILGQKIIIRILEKETYTDYPVSQLKLRIVSRLTRISSSNIKALIMNHKTINFFIQYLTSSRNSHSLVRTLKIIQRILFNDQDNQLKFKTQLGSHIEILINDNNQQIREISNLCLDLLLQ